MKETSSLKSLVHELSRLPGIGEKSAQRLAYFLLRKGAGFTDDLVAALRAVQEKVKLCPNCFSYTEEATTCETCSDPRRAKNIICVVESPSDIFKIEASGAFCGLYHVLHGAIAPLEGVRPEDLKINELISRIEQSGLVNEIILALDADLEGDTTALYLSKILNSRNIKVTRIAYGVPFGSDIDYIDRRTLGKAIENRIEL